MNLYMTHDLSEFFPDIAKVPIGYEDWSCRQRFDYLNQILPQLDCVTDHVEFLLDEVSFTWLWVHETKLPNKDEVISALNQVLAFNIIKKISMVVARGGLCVNLRRAIHNPGNACDIYEDEISDYGSDTDSDDKFNKTDSEFQHYLSDNDDIYAVLSHFINAIN